MLKDIASRLTEGIKKIRPRHFLKASILALLLAFAGTILQVAIYRFVPVTNTHYMRSLAEKNKASVTQTWVPIERISAEMPRAVMTSEDDTFLEHNGFSWDNIKKAIENNRKGMKTHGASTISQQTAKNVFLNNDRTWLRKGLEAYYTILIETIWGKQRIMEVYLNVIELGPGVYGVEAASQKYFHHTAKTINRNEAALMAVVLPNPIKMKISAPSSYVLKRQSTIAARMRLTAQWKP